ncbi:hypothetical protein TNCV_1519641 [Trichonephila clavipes]|nr:hypothetical protein TNCV_1519641 [Trichonephila clavipes]
MDDFQPWTSSSLEIFLCAPLNRLYFSSVNDLMVFTAVLYDSLWFMKANEQNIKNRNWHLRSLLDETETSDKEIDQAKEEPGEIIDINFVRACAVGAIVALY